MKTWWLLVACLAAGSVSAQVLRPINTTQRADVSGRILSPDQLSLPNHGLPTRTLNLATDVNSKRAAVSALDKRTLSLATRDLPDHPLGVLPSQNFSARRAAVQDRRVEPDQVATTTAPITNRLIRATTPAGQGDLKHQLRLRP